MNITMSPCAGLPGASETTASVSGDVLTVNGTPYDLSATPEGGEAMPEGEHPFIGAITRQAGIVHATICWIYGDDAARNQPDWSVADVTDGPVQSPVVKEPTDAV